MGIPGTIDVFLLDGGAISIKGVVLGAAQARRFLGLAGGGVFAVDEVVFNTVDEEILVAKGFSLGRNGHAHHTRGDPFLPCHIVMPAIVPDLVTDRNNTVNNREHRCCEQQSCLHNGAGSEQHIWMKVLIAGEGYFCCCCNCSTLVLMMSCRKVVCLDGR